MAQACWGHRGKASEGSSAMDSENKKHQSCQPDQHILLQEITQPAAQPWKHRNHSKLLGPSRKKQKNCSREQDATRNWTWGKHEQFPDFLRKGKPKSREDCAWQHLQNTTGCNASVTILNGLKIPYFMKGAGLNTNSFSNRTELISWEHSEFPRYR